MTNKDKENLLNAYRSIYIKEEAEMGSEDSSSFENETEEDLDTESDVSETSEEDSSEEGSSEEGSTE